MLRIVFFSGLILVLACIVACQKQAESLPYYNTPDFTPTFTSRDEEVREQVPHRIANFSFTNQRNEKVSEKTIEDKIHVANFIFTTCGVVCPIMTNNMQLVSNAFEKDANVVILSYSVTPWIDDVARLQEYANLEQINNPNWHLLTGSKSSIYQLARQSYFAEEDLGYTKDSTEFLHTEHVLLIDRNKRIRGIYNGTLKLEMKQLIADIRRLKEE